LHADNEFQVDLLDVVQGIFLSKVNEVGPSCKAGLQPGDKLLMV